MPCEKITGISRMEIWPFVQITETKTFENITKQEVNEFLLAVQCTITVKFQTHYVLQNVVTLKSTTGTKPGRSVWRGLGGITE
jgi:hypothetical protein